MSLTTLRTNATTFTSNLDDGKHLATPAPTLDQHHRFTMNRPSRAVPLPCRPDQLVVMVKHELAHHAPSNSWPKFNRCVGILDGYFSLTDEVNQGGRSAHDWCGLDRNQFAKPRSHLTVSISPQNRHTRQRLEGKSCLILNIGTQVIRNEISRRYIAVNLRKYENKGR